jgi:hypothetical protein
MKNIRFICCLLAPAGVAVAVYVLLRRKAVSTVDAVAVSLVLFALYVLVKIRAVVTEMSATLETVEQAGVTAASGRARDSGQQQ